MAPAKMLALATCLALRAAALKPAVSGGAGGQASTAQGPSPLTAADDAQDGPTGEEKKFIKKAWSRFHRLGLRLATFGEFDDFGLELARVAFTVLKERVGIKAAFFTSTCTHVLKFHSGLAGLDDIMTDGIKLLEDTLNQTFVAKSGDERMVAIFSTAKKQFETFQDQVQRDDKRLFESARDLSYLENLLDIVEDYCYPIGSPLGALPHALVQRLSQARQRLASARERCDDFRGRDTPCWKRGKVLKSLGTALPRRLHGTMKQGVTLLEAMRDFMFENMAEKGQPLVTALHLAKADVEAVYELMRTVAVSVLAKERAGIKVGFLTPRGTHELNYNFGVAVLDGITTNGIKVLEDNLQRAAESGDEGKVAILSLAKQQLETFHDKVRRDDKRLLVSARDLSYLENLLKLVEDYWHPIGSPLGALPHALVQRLSQARQRLASARERCDDLRGRVTPCWKRGKVLKSLGTALPRRLHGTMKQGVALLEAMKDHMVETLGEKGQPLVTALHLAKADVEAVYESMKAVAELAEEDLER